MNDFFETTSDFEASNILSILQTSDLINPFYSSRRIILAKETILRAGSTVFNLRSDRPNRSF